MGNPSFLKYFGDTASCQLSVSSNIFIMKALGLAVFSKKGDHKEWQNRLPSSARPTCLAPVSSSGTSPSPHVPSQDSYKPNSRGNHTALFFVIYWETLLLSYFPIYFKTICEGCWAIWGKKKTFQQQLIDSYPYWLYAFLFKQHYFLFCIGLFCFVLTELWRGKNRAQRI